jgi:MoaA/NifB/PqqE/SkfB family radical SAM enzyme
MALQVRMAPQVEDRSDHYLGRIPVLALMPHSRCNCRCLMCDIWKGNREGTSLSQDVVARLSEELGKLGVEEVLLSGGEAMMHPDLWSLCAHLKAASVRITLLSTGLLLARQAEAVAGWCDEVIVSLDGPEPVHNDIRGITGAFAKMRDGIAALRRIRPRFPISARSVVQKRNFRHMAATIAAAHALELDRLSFLAADLTSSAFNRPSGWNDAHTASVGLDLAESMELGEVLESLIQAHAKDFSSGFIAERPERLRRIGQYYLAVNGRNAFPPVRCNAPWVSSVIEADGTVRPCFFHEPIGNIHEARLADILNAGPALAFRRNLDVASNPVCSRCVCTLNL